MRRFWGFIGILTLLVGISYAQIPTPEEILKRVDENQYIEKAFSITTMIIRGRTGTRTVKSKAWVEGNRKALVEYLEPPREAGKKMLKINKQIWIYTPEPNDRIITISGHLLRQSVMGSDLSYEDMTESDILSEDYSATLRGKDKIDNRECWVLDLKAKRDDVAYYSRRIWVDAERYVPLKEERYARSGKLLKTTWVKEVAFINNRWYPKRIVFKDVLSKGEGTEFIVEKIDFNVDIPEYYFSKAALKR